MASQKVKTTDPEKLGKTGLGDELRISLLGGFQIQQGDEVVGPERFRLRKAVNLLDVAIDLHSPLRTSWHPYELGGVLAVHASGYHLPPSAWQAPGTFAANGAPFRRIDPLAVRTESAVSLETTRQPLRLTAIPYFAWGNRGLSEMRVWVPVVK